MLGSLGLITYEPGYTRQCDSHVTQSSHVRNAHCHRRGMLALACNRLLLYVLSNTYEDSICAHMTWMTYVSWLRYHWQTKHGSGSLRGVHRLLPAITRICTICKVDERDGCNSTPLLVCNYTILWWASSWPLGAMNHRFRWIYYWIRIKMSNYKMIQPKAI